MIHPAVRDLFLEAGSHPAFQDLLRGISAGASIKLSGLTTTAKALYSVLLAQSLSRPLIIVVDGNKQAETLSEAVQTFFGLLAADARLSPQLLPALDVVPLQNLSPHAEILEERAIGLWLLATQRVPITILPVPSALLRIAPGDFYRQLALRLRVGDELLLDEVVAHLESIGYERREPVEMVGEYSVRGGILDVFSPEASKPVRIDLFGDQVESIRRFDVESQRSVLKIEDCTLLPLSEYQKSRSLLAELAELVRQAGIPGRDLPPPGEPFPGWELIVPMLRPRDSSVFSLLENPVVLWDEPEQVRGAAERFWKRLEQIERSPAFDPNRIFFQWEDLERQTAGAPQIALRELDVDWQPNGDHASVHISTRPSLSFHGNMPVAIAEARNLVESGNRVAFFASSTGEVERVADILNEYAVPYQLGLEQYDSTPAYLAERAYLSGAVASIYLIKGLIRRGTAFQDSRLVVLGSEDLFESSELVGRAPAGKSALAATFSADLIDLKPGDYVVHSEHGVAQYLGLREISAGENQGDYMLLEYAGGSKLYVPLTGMELVQRFRGAGDSKPALDRMGGATWSRTKSKIKARMRDMADELLKLYASRKMLEGFNFSPDSNWQREFEDAFEFAETRDQVTAIKDIKHDMESPQPMDRLLCGDVGFGKTEVVMRAAFKALGDDKQVVVLAPTTVLAFQHFETFKRRFQPFPVRIEMFSRFRTPKELKAALADLAEGRVDIAIGTHRLLSQDVQFKDLGLVIVDEEQRFGVKHKERLKHLKKMVDVVSMSATPIPRTLHMSLLGLRDMSVIETPPKDRLAINTVVAPFQPELIRSALELELGRGGQVYFLHNRVDSIWTRAAMIQDLVPNARIGVGHGQMGEADLEKTMLRFMRHEFDILVCTTIIENGLDIPLANTIMIENAERYGLSELYQLRGRVGRSNRRAYAYLMVPSDTELTEVARKRLAALKEFSDLGAGFKIAALDLEMRGAGNLLGGEQHGHINAVGFDTYVRLLDETVRELKGEEVVPEIHSTLNLNLDIRIPPEYIADENQRLRAYRRIANAADSDARERVAKELEDRYGAVPDAVRNLLAYSALKSAAAHVGIEAVDRRNQVLTIKFHKETRVDPARLMNIVSKTRGAQFTPAGVLLIPIDGQTEAGAVLRFLSEKLEQLGSGDAGRSEAGPAC
ncbi:MAG TPA: transcription-repair coupling factor [Bryobacteraceae bacterium]|nr:transcription-repair coupling factor [Bryobacteraceae bacterium]